METIEWTNLPEHLWIQILDNLDVKSLLNATEVCTTFAGLFNSTSKLNRKVSIVLNTKHSTRKRKRDNKSSIDSNLKVLQQSKRKYFSVKCDRDFEHITKKAKIRTIRFLFEDVEEIHFTNGVFNCGLFEGSTKLRKLIIDEYHGAERYLKQEQALRSLLVNKPNLKTLHINGPYAGNARLPKIESSIFQLEDLKLFFIEMRSAANIFLTQQSLKMVNLRLDSIQGIEPLFRSKNLHTVKIGICDVYVAPSGFSLTDVFCPSVVNFTVDNTHFKLDVLGMIAASFPNIKNFTLLNASPTDMGHLSSAPWNHLESLTIKAEHEHLKQLNIRSTNFKSFEFRMFCDDLNEDFPINFGDFLSRHQSIRHIKIRVCICEYFVSEYEAYSQRIKRVIAEKLPFLDTFKVLLP